MLGNDMLNKLTPEFKAKCKEISAEARKIAEPRSAIRDVEGLCVPTYVGAAAAENEIPPPSVGQFLWDERYLGKINGPKDDPEVGIYDYWAKQLEYVLNPEKRILEVLVQSSIGCFVGGTKITLLDGTERTLDSLPKDSSFYVYSYRNGIVVPRLATSLGITKYVTELVEIALDNGAVEGCSTNHLWLLPDGTYKEADELQVGDSLMPRCHRKNDAGHEEFRNNISRRVQSKTLVVVPPTPVYDISVPGTNNFALSSDVFVHNSGKTTFALEAMAFWICKLLCMKSPQKFYGLMPQTHITFFIFSVTEDKAFNVCYQQLSEMLNISPFFRERLLPSRGATINLPKNLVIEIGSQFGEHVGGGLNVLCAILDEANFGSGALVQSKTGKLARAKATNNYHLSKVMKAYNAFLRRMESRFLRSGGGVDGQLFMVASAGSENAALSKHIEDTRKRGVRTSHVIEAPIWEVQAYRRGRPTEKFAGDTFRVLKGDQYVDPRILGPDEAVPDGYSVISVPKNYYGAFTANLDDAMRDIANVASAPSNRLIRNRERLHACVDFVRPIPFRTDLIYLDFDDDSEIQDYMSMLVFKDYMKILNELGISNYSVHIDTGLTGDALGIALSHSSGLIEVPGVDLTGRTITEWKQLYTNDFVIKIHNVQNKEIPLFKVVRFILWLKNEFGISFITVSTDGFQQSAILQLLQTQGIPCRILSVDRDDTPYTVIKSCIYDKRISLYNYQPLVTELLELIHYTDIRKVDHPEGGCFAGNTDIVANGVPRRLGTLKPGEEFETYGCRKDGTVIPIKAKALGLTKAAEELCRVDLSNGFLEVCTPDHKWMLISGEYVQAHSLKAGDVLMSRKPEGDILMGRKPEIVKVTGVRVWRSTPMAVYDISSPETGNFCLASGVFVHNSKDVADALTGSIFNLTDITLPAIKKQSETGADIPYIFQRDIEKEMRKRDRAERDEFWPDMPKNLW